VRAERTPHECAPLPPFSENFHLVDIRWVLTSRLETDRRDVLQRPRGPCAGAPGDEGHARAMPARRAVMRCLNIRRRPKGFRRAGATAEN
jgi:hypothetical protein